MVKTVDVPYTDRIPSLIYIQTEAPDRERLSMESNTCKGPFTPSDATATATSLAISLRIKCSVVVLFVYTKRQRCVCICVNGIARKYMGLQPILERFRLELYWVSAAFLLCCTIFKSINNQNVVCF